MGLGEASSEYYDGITVRLKRPALDMLEIVLQDCRGPL